MEHGKCGGCGLDFNGGLIWEFFYKQFTEGDGYWCDKGGNYIEARRRLSVREAKKIADKVAKMYGATRTEGHWGLQIAVYDMWKDRTVEEVCPECGWIRKR